MSNNEEHRTVFETNLSNDQPRGGVLENSEDFFENNMHDDSSSKSEVRRGAMVDTPLPKSNHSSEIE